MLQLIDFLSEHVDESGCFHIRIHMRALMLQASEIIFSGFDMVKILTMMVKFCHGLICSSLVINTGK